MIEKQIPDTSVGTGYTTVFSRTEGRKAMVKQLTFTNTATAVRTLEVWDGDTTTGVKLVMKIILGAQETFTPAEIQYREIEYKDLTARCLEGTEVSVSGSVLEE